MSRNRLCVLTALGLGGLSAAIIAMRICTLGFAWSVPQGPDTWKVTMLVRGKSTGDARLVTLSPLDSPRQHVVREELAGNEFVARPQAGSTDRRTLVWTQQPGTAEGPFRLHLDYTVSIAAHHPTMLDSPPDVPKPKPGEFLRSESGIEADASEIARIARQQTAGFDRPSDVAESLYKFVEREIVSEPSITGTSVGAVECLKSGAGDSAAKARLLAALLRNREIPARLVTGLTLTNDDEQLPHIWVEAWVRDHWLPMCPFYHHYGRLPRTFLVFGRDDVRLVRGRGVRNLSCAFLVSRLPAGSVLPEPVSRLQRLFTALSFFHLPATEQRLIEFLLLLPVAALVICVFRNVVGMPSFGTFAPALIGMVFRETASLPGAIVFVGLIVVGWFMRRMLDRLHLLQVPRTAVMLSLVVTLLIVVVTTAVHWHLAHAVSLFPIVILTGLIERFWTLDEEDGSGHSFKVLLSTMTIAAVVAGVVGFPWVGKMLFRCPETLGLVMAAQVLLGRYTGYRLSEMVRFRDLVSEPPPDVFATRAALRLRRF
ncbi:MAG: 7TM domain-containing protein [Gemmataceae bacterium]